MSWVIDYPKAWVKVRGAGFDSFLHSKWINAKLLLCLRLSGLARNCGSSKVIRSFYQKRASIQGFKFTFTPLLFYRITVFGHAGGVICVALHLLSPVTKSLFQQAILQSGSPLAWWAIEGPKSALEKVSAQITMIVYCLSPETGLYCLTDLRVRLLFRLLLLLWMLFLLLLLAMVLSVTCAQNIQLSIDKTACGKQKSAHCYPFVLVFNLSTR